MTLLASRVEGQDVLERKLKSMVTGLDTTVLLDQSAALLLHSIMRRFLQQVDTAGNPWPVSKAAEYRKKINRGGGTLYDTGKLWQSLQVFQVSDDSRGIGTNVPYGRFHQWGTIHLPVREFLGFSKPDVQLVKDLLVRKIKQALSS